MTTTIPTLIATVDQTKLIMEDQEMVPSTISVPVSMLVGSTTKTLLDLIMVTTTTTPSSIAATTTEMVPSTIKWSPTTTTFLPPIITQDSHQTTRYNVDEISTTISSLTTTTMSTSPSTTPPSTTTVASAFLLENLQESSTVNVSAVVDDNGEIGGSLSSLKNTFETIKDNLTDVYNNYIDVGGDIQNKTKQFLQNDGLKNLTDLGQSFIPGAMFKSNTANDGVDPQQQQQQVTVAYYALGIIFVALMLIIGFIAIYHYKLKKYFNGEPEDDRSVAQRTKRNPNDSNPNNNNNNTGSGNNNNNNNNNNTNNGTDVKQQPLTKNLTAKVQDVMQGVGSAINTADQLAKTAKNKIEDVEAVVSKQLEKYEKKPEDGAQNKADTDTVVVQMDVDKNPTKGNTVINPNNSNNSANAEPDSESDDEDPQIIQKRKRQTDKDRTDAAELNEL